MQQPGRNRCTVLTTKKVFTQTEMYPPFPPNRLKKLFSVLLKNCIANIFKNLNGPFQLVTERWISGSERVGGDLLRCSLEV